MKKYNELNNYKVIPFNRKEHFLDLTKTFFEVQKKVQIGSYATLGKKQSEWMITNFLVEEFNNLIKSSLFVEVLYDLDREKPIGLAFFGLMDNNYRLTRTPDDKVLFIPLAFLDPSYKFNLKIANIMKEGIKNVSKRYYNARIYSVFGARSKMNSYLKFLKKVFGCKIIQTHNAFQKHLAEWPTRDED
jgi:hypothetical protein